MAKCKCDKMKRRTLAEDLSVNMHNTNININKKIIMQLTVQQIQSKGSKGC